jgi:hypothetical protein
LNSTAKLYSSMEENQKYNQVKYSLFRIIMVVIKEVIREVDIRKEE